ncbi:MAG: EAL domain-containing protein [bacterium]|nr:EAL domain-containing protein [bacterium]
MNLHMVVTPSAAMALERELITHLLALSQEETTSIAFCEQVVVLLRKHPLFFNKATALWNRDTEDHLNIMASQDLNAGMEESLGDTISYTLFNEPFLTMKHTPDPKLNQMKTDIYLEKNHHCLLGISVWDTHLKPILDLTQPFLKEVFILINLICLKLMHNDHEKKLITSNQKSAHMLSQLTHAMERSPVLIVIVDNSGIIEYVNAKVIEKTGYGAEELLGHHSRIFQSEKTSEDTYMLIWELLSSGKDWSGELLNKNKNGDFFWTYAAISPLINHENEITHFVAVIEDISQKKNYEEKLSYQATYDNLTNLPNRFFGYSSLENAIAKAAKNKTKLAILFLDIDDFKHINDSWGPIVGDNILKQVSERYLEILQKKDTLVRLGSDEFMVILENVGHESEVELIAKKYQELIAQPYVFDATSVFISSSIGVAFFPEHGEDAKTLMRNADIALCQSKMRGKNNYTLFINTMAEVLTHRIQITNELHQVLDRDELFVHYQPIINLKNNTVFAAEALLRWQSATLGPVMPEQIIPIAEETGLIIPLGYWILKKVCSHIKEWQLKTGEQIKIAVNISTVQLKQKDFVPHVKAIIKQAEISPQSLIFEITESAFIDDSVLILKQLNELTKMKIDCSLDDFGMGYSSLNYIRSYPFKSLKIDKAFIQGIDTSNDDLSLVNSIISLSKSLNLTVIAEGIETRKQLDLLRSMNCDMVQGWYFSQALDKELLISYLNNE